MKEALAFDESPNCAKCYSTHLGESSGVALERGILGK